MEIRLYSQFSKRSNSTKRPSGNYVSKDAKLKEETSILNPTFILSNFDGGYNYVYIPSWGRYYFVSDVVKNITGLFEISCTCDRLATFKDNIGNYNCYVERCSNSSKVNTDICDIAVSSTESVIDVKQAKTSLWNASGGVIICRTINVDYGITTFIGSMSTFKDLFNPNMDDTEITDVIKSVFNYYMCSPGEYVLDVYFLAVPLSVLQNTGNTSLAQVSSGWYTGGGCYRWTSNTPIVNNHVTLNKPSPKYQDWRHSNGAFTQYSIYLPSVGEVALSGDIIDNTLKLEYSIDINTGEMVYFLRAVDSNNDESLIATYHGNVKSGLQVGSMSPNGSGFLSSALNLATGIGTGNPIAIGTSLISATQNIISPSPSIHGSMGSCAGYLTENDVIITRLSKDSGDNPNTLGQPCCKNLTLSTIPGYIKTVGASIDIIGYDSDKDSINGFLDGGFYYE